MEAKKKNKIVRRNGKVYGEIKGNTYYTTRTKDHIFRMYHSVNISKEVVRDIENCGTRIVDFKVFENNKPTNYKITIDDIKKCKIYYGADKEYIVTISSLKEKQGKPLLYTKGIMDYLDKKEIEAEGD